MSDKTVKIEYQFTGEDVGLSDKIDDINKKLDKLSDEASSTGKKIEDLNKESTALTSSLQAGANKIEAYSDDLKEMQKELDKATADVEKLNQALRQQQKIMQSFNTGSNGAVNNQKELNALAQQTTQQLTQVSKLQNKINASGINFKNIPQLNKLKSDLKAINNEVKQISNPTDKIATTTNTRKLNNLNIKNAPFKQKTIGEKKTASQIAEEYDKNKFQEFIKKNPNPKYSKLKEDIGDDSVQLVKTNNKISSFEDDIKNLSNKKSERYNVLKINLASAEKERDKIAKRLATRRAKAMKIMGEYTEDGYKIDKTNQTVPSLEGKRNYRKNKPLTTPIKEQIDNKQNNRKLPQMTAKKSEWADKAWNQGHPESTMTYKMANDLKALSSKYPEFKVIYDKVKDANNKVTENNKQSVKIAESIKALKTLRNDNIGNKEVYNKLKSNIASLETKQEELIKQSAIDFRNAVGVKSLAKRKMEAMNYQKYLQPDAPATYSEPTKKRRTLSSLSNQAKVITDNTKQVDNLTSKINSKAVELQNALNTGDKALIGQLQGEVKNLLSQRQALEKLSGKTLTNTANTNYQTKAITTQPNVMSNVSDSTRNLLESNYQNATATVNSQLQTQQALNNEKQKTLQIEQQIAQQNERTANKQANNIKAQIKADEQKHQLALANMQAYEESRQRQYQAGREYANQKRWDSANFKQSQQATKNLVNLPNELKNVSNAYKKANATIADENTKLKQINENLNNLASKGALKSSDFTKIEKQLTAQQKRMVNASASVDKANQRAVEALTLANNRLNKLQNVSNGTQTYRVRAGQTVSGKTGNLMNYKIIKANAGELQAEMKKLDSTMMSYSKNAMSTSTSLLKMQNSLGSLTNITQLAGKGLTTLGSNVQKLGTHMMNTGRSIQQVANSMRVLQVGAVGVLGGAINESLEFNKSLMGVASTLNRLEVQNDGSIKVMTDVEFDANIDKISESAKELAKNSLYDSTHIMEGFRYTSLAGWSTSEMVETLPIFTNLATVARLEGEEFVNIVDTVTDSLASLGMAYEGIDLDGDGVFDEKIKKDAESLAQEVERLSDVMVKAQSISNTTVDELAEGYKKAGTQLSTVYGLSLEEITSMFAVLANKGIKGSSAATGLSSIMANLTAKTGQASKALDEIQEKTGINVTAWDENGVYVGIEEHLGRLSKAFKKLKEMYGSEYGADNLQLAQMLGGKHHFKTLTKLLEGYETGEFKDTLTLLSNSSGSTADMASTVNESTWAKLQIAISKVKTLLLELGDAMMPVVEKVIEGIGRITDAFSKLTDDQRVEIVKLLAVLAILPTALSAISAVFTIFGGITNAFGGLIKGAGNIVNIIGSIAGAFKIFIGALSGGSGIIGALATTFPTIASTFSALAPAILACVVAFILFKDQILSIGSAFTTAWAEADGFFDFILKWIMNIGKEIEHSIVQAFNNGIGKGGFSDWLLNVVEGLLKIMKLIPGVGKQAEKMLNNLKQIRKTGLTSMADEEAQRAGYANYEEYKQGVKANKKKEVIQELTTKVTTKLDDLSGGKFNKLIKTFEGLGEEEEVKLTAEVLAETSSDYRRIIKEIEENENKKLELEANMQLNQEKLYDVNKELVSLKNELKELEINPEANKDKIAEIKQRIEELTTQRDSLINLDVEYEGQLEQIDAELTKDREAKLVIDTTIKEAGAEDDFEYQNRKNAFKETFGFELVFENEADIERAKELIRKIPGVEKALRAQLEVTTDPAEYNKIVMALEELERDKKTAEVLVEVQKSQKIMEEKDAIIKDLEQENIEIEANIKFLTNNGEIKDIDLPEEKKQAVTNYRIQKDSNERKIESAKGTIEEEKQKIEAKIAEPDDIAWKSVNDLWSRMYIAQNEDLATAMGDYTRGLIRQYFGEGPEGDMGRMLGLPMQSGDWDYNEVKSQGAQSNSISFEDVEQKVSFDASEVEQGTVIIQQNTDAISENIDAISDQQNTLSEGADIDTSGIENYSETMTSTAEQTQQAVEETLICIDDLNTATSEIEAPPVEDLISALEQAGINIDELSNSVEAMKESLNSISTEILYNSLINIKAMLDEIANSVTEIHLMMLNLGVESFSTAGQALLDKVIEARTELTNLFGYLNNTGLESFSNLTTGLKEDIEQIKISLSTLGSNVDTSAFNSIGETLRASIECARTALLNICGVARNSGVASMKAMGDSLKSSIDNARQALLNVCGVARNSGVGAFSSMGNALVSTINTALSKVETIAGRISSMKQQINSIKMPAVPSIATASVAPMPVSLANNPSTVGALRSITNNSVSNSIANTSNFSFNMNGYSVQTRQDAKNTARILTTHLKRRGF